MKTLKFNKEPLGWFVELKEWEGDKADLEMVLGADTMLDILAQGESSIELDMSDKEIEHYEHTLIFIDKENGGAWYYFESKNELVTPLTLWLCKVTKFVFGKLPNKIYIK